MQAAPARYVSVSELYSTDEVELLLDEIRELEPTSCRGEDLQDFEIAGSGCLGAGSAGAGTDGRSPCGTPGTEQSWDSHAQYRAAGGGGARPALLPLFWRGRHLYTARGAAGLCVVACCGAACACVWAAVGLRVAALPLPARVQLLQLAALSSALLHAALLALQLTGLAALLPLDWQRVGLWAAAWSALSLAAGAALTLHALLLAPEYRWAPEHLARLLYSACGLGLGGACASCALVGIGVAAAARARGARAGGTRAGAGGTRARAGGTRVPAAGAAYRAVPVASTSRDDPL